MFEKSRTIRRQYAALCHYEDQLRKKSNLIHETEGILQHAMDEIKALEARNEALASENRRLSENRDLDEDMMNEMYADYREMYKRQREFETLADENYRLWAENAILLGALVARDTEIAAEIARRAAPC